MPFTYKLFADNLKTGAKSTHILRKEDNACIPMSESNRDYIEYLDWVALGNTAEPAD